MTSTTPIKQITLCADDFALHPAVDAAVVALAKAGRLSATSCMTTAARWPQAAQLLAPLRPALQVGLHWNLTEGHGQSAQSLLQVLARAYSGRIDPSAAAESLQRQLDAFEQHTGTPPDFIDGHQHIHQLPGLRQALLQVLRQRYGADTSQTPWVRSTLPAQWGINKAALLALLGGYRLHQMLGKAGVRHNRQFAGVYGFDAATPEAYGAHMAAWLHSAPSGTLLMCHPASAAVPGDTISAQRMVEFAYVASPAFAELLQRSQAVLVQGAATNFKQKQPLAQ
ncbi:MAG: ChbG/HpnK family deacetylase [Giesbergeria sp.]|nr:ChbG/HpnK family deacetylase [Giesbergeria sp.]MBP6321712.1 ChbG/HpnK family deacetylase [Giesbergeria sp.]MBP7916422.1 ChbG/HpnK family deacetylase [Giesbergeria sp.]MBP8028835.1 ChbG/HpnK family deacetylase [Giesbergeria sp.]MBP8839624.1 ChbG/HpnK family deacetylase [Giesbergeria sp.]